MGLGLILAHAGLMTVAWFVCMPAGILFAATKPARAGKPDWWFKIHRTLMQAAAALIVVGVILAWLYTDDLAGTAAMTSGALVHKYVGLTMVGVLVPHVTWASARPDKPEGDEPKTNHRSVWEIAHKSIGYLLALGALAQAFTGPPLLDLGNGPGPPLVGQLLVRWTLSCTASYHNDAPC